MNLNISLQNLFKYPDIDPLGFALLGMGIVFTGLLVISLYITFLPHFLIFLGKRKRFKRHRRVFMKMKEKSVPKKDTGRDEILAAVALALHLHSNHEDDKQKITWKDMEPTSWHTAGKIHALTLRHNIFSRSTQL